jgi:hypothetical protein
MTTVSPVVPVAQSAELGFERVYTALSGGTTFKGAGALGSFVVGQTVAVVEAQYQNTIDASAVIGFGYEAGLVTYERTHFRAHFNPAGGLYYGRYMQGMPTRIGTFVLPVGARVKLTCELDGTVTISKSTNDGLTWDLVYTFPEKATGTVHGRFYVPQDRKTYQLRQVGYSATVSEPAPTPAPPAPVPAPPAPVPAPPAPTPAPTPDPSFAAYYPEGWTANRGTAAVSQPSVGKPALSTDIFAGGLVDPVFGTQIRRITSVSQTSDSSNIQLRHEYSRRQAFNANSTRQLVQSTKGHWFLLDANSLDIIPSGGTAAAGVGSISGLAGDCEPIWHPTDPDKLWFTSVNGGLIWYERNFATGQTSVLFDMTTHMRALGGNFSTVNVCWFNGEGRPSNDGRFWGFHCETRVNSDYTSRGFVMYDRQNNTIVGSMPNTGPSRPNWVGTSPLGTHVLISWYGKAQESLAKESTLPISAYVMEGGYQLPLVGCRAYTANFSAFQTLQVLGEHSDLAMGKDGKQYYCAVTFHGQADGATDGGIVCVCLETGTRFTLPRINAYGTGTRGDAFHISGCAYDKPGWLVIGKHYGVGAGPYDGQVFAVEISPTATPVRLAHHHSVGNSGYFAEPQPTCNRDLTRVVFASDWNGGSAVEDYVICLPPTAFN